MKRERNVMVAMRDGVRLATDLYFPDGDGPWPVLLERTPYDKLGTELVKSAGFFARHGYAVALQDVRGREVSEGEWYPFREEGPDGYDTCGWLVQQPWCNGQIGTIGLSYSGCTQVGLGALGAPGLASQWISMGPQNYRDSAMRQGGAMELRFYIYAFRMAATSKEAQADPVKRIALQRAHNEVGKFLLPPGRVPPKAGLTPLKYTPGIERWVHDVLRHGDYRPYWSDAPALSILERYDTYPDVAITYMSSWYDTYVRGTIGNYVEMTKRHKSPTRLLMGPWTHGGQGVAFSGDVEFGPDAALHYDDARLRWFDATVRGRDAAALAKEPPVSIFVMGGGSGRKTPAGRMMHGGTWRQLPAWPPAGAEARALHLRAGGRLTWEAPAAGEAADRYVYDPADPVPTVGGSISAAENIIPAGGYDQRDGPRVFGSRDDLPLSARADVLVYSSEPLAKDLEVTGAVEVVLWCASSAVDTDFTAKLIDAYPSNPDYPEGYELNVADSIVRARYRSNGESADPPLEPGRPYELRIRLYATSNVFCAGHRIRVHVSSSNYPRFDPNPNTGAPLGESQVTERALQTVYHDVDRPSRVILPVMG